MPAFLFRRRLQPDTARFLTTGSVSLCFPSVLRRIFGLKTEEVTGLCKKKMHNEGRNFWHFSPNTVCCCEQVRPLSLSGADVGAMYDTPSMPIALYVR